MSRRYQYFQLVLVATAVLHPVSGFAQSSQEYARMANAAWNAFECSSLASKIGNVAEQERLFLYGFEQGKSFISAVQEEKIEQEDISREVPVIMLLLLQGPSEDFMLGRVFESAQDSALEDVYRNGDVFFNDSEQSTIAENKFSQQNCSLIGR